MKRLLLDVETAPNLVHVWGLWQQNVGINQIIDSGYTLCWAAKWYGDKKVMFNSVFHSSPKEMASEIHALIDEADAVIHYNGCVAPGNRVLTKSLEWVDVASLKEGDELLAFEEQPAAPNKPRKYCTSVVEKAFPIMKECSEILLSDGRTIVASNDHPWLTFAFESARNFSYVNTDSLSGGRLVSILDTWTTKESYSAGYLSAFLDGEGCVSQVKRKRMEATTEYTCSLTFAQKDETITSKLLAALEHEGFSYTVKNYDPSQKEMKCIRLTGGLPEVLKFLGSIRPEKLSRLDFDKIAHAKVIGKDVVEIVSVTPVGLREVIGLQTSSRTYIVEGFPCHNSKFDMPTLNKEFVLMGMNPPAPYKQIDLLQTARRQFRFPSNKLDYIAKSLGLGEKVKHIGHELWIRCMNNDKKAWDQMRKYNIQDVRLLEKVYDRLLPWIKSHPNMGLYSDEDTHVCTNCGSTSLQRRGYAHTQVGIYQRFQCNDCGTWGRTRTVEKQFDRKNVLVKAT